MLTTLWIQKNLNFLGYNAGAEDNVKGQQTTAAIKSFQSDFKLAVDRYMRCKHRRPIIIYS